MGCELRKFNKERNHVPSPIGAHQDLKLSDLVNNLRTVTSRLTRECYHEYIAGVYCKRCFWHRSYCIVSAGGAPVEIIKHDIENESFE